MTEYICLISQGKSIYTVALHNTNIFHFGPVQNFTLNITSELAAIMVQCKIYTLSLIIFQSINFGTLRNSHVIIVSCCGRLIKIQKKICNLKHNAQFMSTPDWSVHRLMQLSCLGILLHSPKEQYRYNKCHYWYILSLHLNFFSINSECSLRIMIKLKIQKCW